MTDHAYWANHLARNLREAGCRAEVAGSVRRGRTDPHDLEIVAMPIYDPQEIDLRFPGSVGALDQLIADWAETGVCALDTETRRNGPRLKRFVLGAATGLPGFVFELYIAEQKNWGNIFFIRTGDKDWSATCMSPRRKGGLLPDNLVQTGGFLWRFPSAIEAFAYRKAVKEGTAAEQRQALAQAERLAIREEADFFAILGLPFVQPAERTEQLAQSLTRRRAA